MFKFKNIDISWTHDNHLIYENEIDFDIKNNFKNFTKKQQAKCYNFAVLALALTSLDDTGVARLFTDTADKKNATMLTGILCVGVIVKFVCMYIEGKRAVGEDLNSFGYTDSKIASNSKDIALLILCLALALAPFLLF